MAVDEGLIAWVVDAMAPLGPVTRRAMMGGATLYCDGTVFAIVAADSLWFKADAVSEPAWDAESAERFTYTRGDRTLGSMNYRRVPDDVFDADAMRRWGELAVEAGARTPARKSRRRRG